MVVTFTTGPLFEFTPCFYLHVNWRPLFVLPPSCRCRDCGFIYPLDDIEVLHGFDPVCVGCLPVGGPVFGSFVWGDDYDEV